MGILKKKFNEFSNSRKLSKLYPCNTFDKIIETFESQKNCSDTAISLFKDYIYKAPFGPGLWNDIYEKQPAGAQLVYQQEIFMTIWDTFVKHIKAPNPGHTYGLPVIETIEEQEYKNMPKRFRPAFIKYENRYKLHLTGDEDTLVIGINKKDIKNLHKMLVESRILIDRLLEDVPPLGLKSILEGTFFVSDKQLESVIKIHKIFLEIAKTIKLYLAPQTNKKTSGAYAIYQEYKDELTRKNKYLNAYQKFKQIKQEKINTLHDNMMYKLRTKGR